METKTSARQVTSDHPLTFQEALKHMRMRLSVCLFLFS